MIYKRRFILSLFKLKSVKTIILKTCMANLVATWLEVQLTILGAMLLLITIFLQILSILVSSVWRRENNVMKNMEKQ